MFYLNTDASAFAISAVLLQKHGKNLLPIAYFSKALRKAETRYPAIQLELKARGSLREGDICIQKHTLW